MTGNDLIIARRSAGKPWVTQDEVRRRAGIPLQRVVDFEAGKPLDNEDRAAVERAVNELLSERRDTVAA